MKDFFFLPSVRQLLVLAEPVVRTPVPGWQMALTSSRAYGLRFSGARATLTPASGNVPMAGHFTSPVSFVSTSLTSAGRPNVLVIE